MGGCVCLLDAGFGFWILFEDPGGSYYLFVGSFLSPKLTHFWIFIYPEMTSNCIVRFR